MFAHPKDHIEFLDLDHGMKVLDVGAGAGHHAIELAKAVGKTGTVFALDVQKDLLARVKKEAAEAHLHNVEIIWADIEKKGGTRLQDGICDRVLVANVMFQLEQKLHAIDEIRRVLKPAGRVMIIDWKDSVTGHSEHVSMIINPIDMEQLWSSAGFKKEREFDAGSHHYGIIMRKQ
jgi:ubiquinone/menaquinone biosynthesis C-methylase UbiE